MNTRTESFLASSAEKYLSPALKDRIIQITLLLDEIYSEVQSSPYELLSSSILSKVSNDENVEDYLTAIHSIVIEWDSDKIDFCLKFFTTLFHLLNQAELEEIHSINQRRKNLGTINDPMSDSIYEAVKYLKDQGIKLNEALDIVAQLDIIPTLTAHPTEARRKSLLDKQKSIVADLEEYLFGHLGKLENRALREEIKRSLTMLMLTDDLRTVTLTIQDEIKNTIYHCIESLWFAVPELYKDLKGAFLLYYQHDLDIKPFLRFRSWVGGDRDGNPSVTASTTEHAIKSQRMVILSKYRDSLDELYKDLSLMIPKTLADDRLMQSIGKDLDNIVLSQFILNRLQNEPLRLKVVCMQTKLDTVLGSVHLDKLSDAYSPDEFIEDLETLIGALKNLGYPIFFKMGPLNDLLIRAKTFRFILMSLDLRQHSDIHCDVLDELFNYRKNLVYSSFSEADKQVFLARAIMEEGIVTAEEIKKLSHEARQTLDTFLMLRDQCHNDSDSICSYIVSMTHKKSDLLEVLLLLKITGAVRYDGKKFTSLLDIIPLYETIEDIGGASALIADLLEDSCYRCYIQSRGNFQEIMLGYSDSNKDGGMGMATYALNNSQVKLATVLAEKSVSYRIFHGRGGSVSRGGGRTNAAILALPSICQNGRIRMTEQGEVISYRYGSILTAKRHLEQIVSAVLKGMVKQPAPHSDTDQQILFAIAEQSEKTYKEFILSDKFWEFFISSSPIEHISRLPIASRPASRNSLEKGTVDFDNLRAIPWVFSWVQTRYNIPGWFGLGTALKEIARERDAIAILQKLYSRSSMFNHLLNNMSFEMARSRMEISKLYSELSLNPHFHEIILEEYNRCLEMFKLITRNDTLLERIPVIEKSIEFRNPLADVINLIQVELLRRWGAGNRSERMQKSILASINGVAASMQTTG